MTSPYRVLVTGSREWADGALIRDVLAALLRELHPEGRPGEGRQPVLVHGAARGADSIARDVWLGWGLPDEAHPVTREQWQSQGRKAGVMRNVAMVDAGCDVVLAFIKDQSAGATQCAGYAESLGVPVRRFTA